MTTINSDLTVTYIFGEQALAGSWSHPDVPELVFAYSVLPGSSVEYHGGPIGSGLPVELLFRGDWWNSPEGAARRVLIETRTQAVLASDYFSELRQYGVEPPHWRGAKIVTSPAPPAAFNSNDDQHVVPDLIDDLIEELGTRLSPSNRADLARGLDLARGRGGHVFTAAFAAGQALPFDEAVRQALSTGPSVSAS